MIFVDKNNYILYLSEIFMPKCTPGELFTILTLSEIFILEIFLFFFVNVALLD
jgi:hypothetical protein